VLAVGAHAFLDLRGKFAGRREDQRADRRAALGVALGGGVHQPVQHRQREPGGLAGAGLRAGEQVAALKDGGDGLFLDRRRRVVTRVGNSLEQRLGEPQFVE
jgi:hypothetical protein